MWEVLWPILADGCNTVQELSLLMYHVQCFIKKLNGGYYRTCYCSYDELVCGGMTLFLLEISPT